MHASCKTATLKPVVPFLAEGEFRAIKKIAVGFEQYVSYDDWLDVQEGKQVGYWMAGVEVKIVEVSTARFARWCARRRIWPSEQSLMEFAECDTILD